MPKRRGRDGHSRRWLQQTGWLIAGQVVTPTPEESADSAVTPRWRIEATRAEPDTAYLTVERVRRSTFILVSNETRRSARELLQAYKTQSVVEQNHAVIKGPLSIAPVFLQDTRKIEAYVHVVCLALLLWYGMQAVMRQNQERLGISLPYPNGARQPTLPTTSRVRIFIAVSSRISPNTRR